MKNVSFSTLILAAGLGTRLKPLTDTMPKALVPVANKPLLEHLIDRLKANGCTDIVVNVHHFAQQIIDFLTEKQNFGIHIQVSDERDQLLETIYSTISICMHSTRLIPPRQMPFFW